LSCKEIGAELTTLHFFKLAGHKLIWDQREISAGKTLRILTARKLAIS
jgi:hypothetical protein